MAIHRIKAILMQELYITKHSMEIFMDIMAFPLMSIAVFGFLSSYLVGSTNTATARSILLAMILWQLAYIVQYSISVGSLWNIWSRNLSNLFITPVSAAEYLTAHTLSGVVKSFVMLILSALLSSTVFHFNIFGIGALNLILLFLNLMAFAFALGIVILGMIFRFGTRIQALAWGLMPLLQPLTATFYPVQVLPAPLQTIAWLLPPTYVFEAMRANLHNPAVQWTNIGYAAAGNIVFLIIAIVFFNYMFRKSKDTGQFARNEG